MYHVSAPPLTKVKRYSALNTVDFYMGPAYIKKGGSSKSRSVHDTILLCGGSTGLLHCIHHPGAHRAGEAGEGACNYYRRRNSNMASGC